jgi:hypothetical protein
VIHPSIGRISALQVSRRGTTGARTAFLRRHANCAVFQTENAMNNIIYIVGLVVVVIAVLSFFGLR